MARIRTIKPEFWTSEQVMEITPLARLAFIAMWNFADDRGVHPASHKTLRAEAFAGDDNITADTVAGLVGEMQREKLVAEFEIDGKHYWHVTGWSRHQKIDKPTYRHPEPPNEAPCRRELGEYSASAPRELAESSPPESNGVDWNGKEEATASVASKPATPDKPACPAEEIISLYHEAMPDNPRVRVLNDARRKTIRARWKEASALSCKPFGYSNRDEGLAAWRRFFKVCAESNFLTGRAPAQPGKPPFVADIDFLMSPAGFAKCLENKYHREVAA